MSAIFYKFVRKKLYCNCKKDKLRDFSLTLKYYVNFFDNLCPIIRQRKIYGTPTPLRDLLTSTMDFFRTKINNLLIILHIVL